MNYQERLAALRTVMAKDQIAAVILGTTDPHQSAAVAEHWKAVQWFTGFSGSLATCVVTPQAVAFWTDGRYTLQAQRQLDASVEQYSVNDLSHPTYPQWILSHTQQGDKVALDGRVLSIADSRHLKAQLEQGALTLCTDKDYPDMVWGEERPAIPTVPLIELDLRYAGEDRPHKLARLRGEMKNAAVQSFLTCSLDDIGWFVNLRGFEQPRLPIFHAYLLVEQEICRLFVGLGKLSDEIKTGLIADGITPCEMNEVFAAVKALPAGQRVYFDPYKTGVLFDELVPTTCRVVEGLDFITALKSRKNAVEQENLRRGHVYEAVALMRLIKYIKDNIGKAPLDEYHLGEHLESYRKRCESYVMPGNMPIVAYMANAALAHYRPDANNTTVLQPEGFFLFDVCGHYYEGTTDITRTVVCGPLTQEMIHDYTVTLKSHIALATQRFPYGCTGVALDAIVKKVHWDRGLHFTHGTGHGIGYFLDIHDGPCRIGIQPSSAFPYGTQTPLEPGMLFSNEPGVYKGGKYGIRLENDVLVQEDMQNEFARFLRFETLTYCPFDLAAVDAGMLTEQERQWLNDYHSRCYELLSPLLEEEEVRWLWTATRAI